MELRIPNVKVEKTTYWQNEKCAEFQYNATQVWYQLIELTPDGRSYIIKPSERNKENCPVIALGFVAYLIHNWGKSETEIYKGFYELCLSDFINKEEKLPGAFKRDLKAENYKQHIVEENTRVAFSQKIYPYLTDNDSKLIIQYTKSYFDFIKEEYEILPLVKPDYSELLSELSGYISGINANEFTNIIEHHSMTSGTPPARWIGEKVDACYFCDHLNMTHKEWNKLFYFPDGKKIHTKYKDKLDKGSPINEILKTHAIK